MTLIIPPIKIRLHNKIVSVLPTSVVSSYSTSPGDYVIANSSRIHSDSLMPSIFLGTDSKNGRKHYFFALPYLYKHLSGIEQEFEIFGSLTTRLLRIEWGTEDITVNRIVRRVSQMLMNREPLINIDAIIAEEVSIAEKEKGNQNG